MPRSTAKSKGNESTSKLVRTAAHRTAANLDILFAGPLLFVPAIWDGVVTDIEVFSPCNGHPIGAVFMPEVFFSDAELDDPQCERWPAPSSFSLLDPHSYAIELTQRSGKKDRPFRAADIPETNHKVRPGRRLSSDWEVAIAMRGRLSGWSSHRVARVWDGLFHGADVPTTATTASLQRLSFAGVTGAEFCGASREPREYLRANISKGGSLIVIGEIPYQSTLLHERKAIDAIAKLAGLDFHLAETAPSPYRTRLMDHVTNCGHSIVLTE
jgi:hypothetical protein